MDVHTRLQINLLILKYATTKTILIFDNVFLVVLIKCIQIASNSHCILSMYDRQLKNSKSIYSIQLKINCMSLNLHSFCSDSLLFGEMCRFIFGIDNGLLRKIIKKKDTVR